MTEQVGLGPGAPVLAADVGGTETKIGVVDESGHIGPPVRVPTPPGDPDTPTAILKTISEAARDLPGFDRVEAVGVALPGVFDEDREVGVWSENLGWRDVDFGSLVREHFRLPAVCAHDVRAAALAELRLGAARGLRDVAVLTVGTGIAAAIFVDGRPHVRGGYAGEIGHVVVDPAGEPCPCGNRGCLEATASAAAIARRYGKASGEAVTGAREVLERARSGDRAAKMIWSSAVDALASGIAHLSAAMAPQAIVVGGGLSEAGEDLFGPLQVGVDARFRLRPTRLSRASLGEDAGVIGAAIGARESAIPSRGREGGPRP